MEWKIQFFWLVFKEDATYFTSSSTFSLKPGFSPSFSREFFKYSTKKKYPEGQLPFFFSCSFLSFGLYPDRFMLKTFFFSLLWIVILFYLQIWVFGSCDQGVFSVWLVRKYRKRKENVRSFRVRCFWSFEL